MWESEEGDEGVSESSDPEDVEFWFTLVLVGLELTRF